MTHKTCSLLLSALLALCLLLSACAAPAAQQTPEPSAEAAQTPEQTEAPAESAAPEQTEAPAESAVPLTPEEVFNQEVGDPMNARAEKYAPKVTTLASGVQIQRTPDETFGGVYHNPASTIYYNNYYLDADNRGCGACHQDLGELLNNMDYYHVDLTSSLDFEVTVSQCLDCHSYSPGYVTEINGFGLLIHGLHDDRNAAFSQMGGDCWSCHAATNDGEGVVLWDQVKHEKLRGILDVAEATGEFTWNQDKTVTGEEAFSYDWLYVPEDYERYANEMAGVEPDPAAYDEWTITVKGTVENPVTFTLSELIEKAPSVTTTMTIHCTDNPMGGGLISNCEITGIPVSWLLEQAQMKPGSTKLYCRSRDGFNWDTMTTSLENMEECGAYLVYQVDGNPIPYKFGYPVQLWTGGMAANSFIKNVAEIEVADTPVEGEWVYKGWVMEDGEHYYNKPNVGISAVKEGQIIEVGEPFVFEGYAAAFDLDVTAIEISLDRGANWTSFDTTGADRTQWIWWNYTFTPDAEGAYVFTIRAVGSDGSKSDEPVEVMVVAK